MQELLSREPSLEELFLAHYGARRTERRRRRPCRLSWPSRPPARRGRLGPRTVVARQTARKAVRSGVLWGYVFGLYLATQALAYASSYKTGAQRAALGRRTSGRTPGSARWSALPTSSRPSPASPCGSASPCWPSSVPSGACSPAPGSCAGEEDAGRWELLLAGQTTRRAAAAQALAGLGCGLVALWAVTAVITVVVGRSSKVDIGAGPARCSSLWPSWRPAAMFLAVGALASQLAATRRQAAAYAGAALGVSYALRMVADSGIGLGWLRGRRPSAGSRSSSRSPRPSPSRSCRSPASPRCWALSPCTWRGSGTSARARSPTGHSSAPHTRLLFGPSGLDVRLARSGRRRLGRGHRRLWAAARACRQVGRKRALDLVDPHAALSRLGASGAEAYLGVAFLLWRSWWPSWLPGRSAPLGPKRPRDGSTTSSSGRSRAPRWLAGRLVVAALVVRRRRTDRRRLHLARRRQPAHRRELREPARRRAQRRAPGLCILGIGAFVFGVWPRAAAVATYGVLVWSFLVELVGGIVGLNHWVLDTSVFHQMAAAPAVSPDWTSGGVLLALGAVAALAGGVAFVPPGPARASDATPCPHARAGRRGGLTQPLRAERLPDHISHRLVLHEERVMADGRVDDPDLVRASEQLCELPLEPQRVEAVRGDPGDGDLGPDPGERLFGLRRGRGRRRGGSSPR